MKKLNIKALVINHAEKMVFGLFAFIVLIVLAKTTWARYPKAPDELKQEIKKVRDKISAPTNVWPPDQEKLYNVVDFSDKARQLFAPLAPIALSRYSFTPPLFHPLYRKDEPRREPLYEPVQNLIAKAGLAALSVLDESVRSQTEEPQMAAAEPAKEKMNSDDEFGPAAAGGKPTAGNRPPVGGPAGGPAAVPPANPISLRPLGVPGGSEAMGSSSSLAAQQSDVKARGVRFVAIRGVFPLRKQIENYKNALRLTESEASSLVEIMDFVLERQTATAGANPWPNDKWETVGVESALEVLNECSELDPSDPVPAAMRDAVITMNLPLRLIGRWSEYATHPKIKEDELKGDAIEAQNKALESMGAALSESNSPDGGKAPRKKGGLSAVQRDPKQLVKRIKSTPGAMDMYKQMMQPGASSSSAMMPRPTVPGPAASQMGSSAMMRGASDLDKLVINSRYLLFRFFDFDVQSGMAYRYRVRLKLRNPNFELSPEELGGADIEITKGEERETPYSNISNPEVVPTTTNYFLKDIEREPYHDEKFKTTDKPVAQLSVFDWDTNLGTVVKDGLNVPSIGAFIGGVMGLSPRKETPVLDVVEGVIKKKKELKFSTLDVLVDVESDFDISVDQHPDLKLPANGARGMSRIGLVEEALVATAFGDIKTIDPVSEKSKEEWWNDRVERERKSFKEGEPPKKTSRLGALMGEGATEEGGTSKKRRRSSPLMVPSSSAGMQQSSPAEGSGSMQRGNR